MSDVNYSINIEMNSNAEAQLTAIRTSLAETFKQLKEFKAEVESFQVSVKGFEDIQKTIQSLGVEVTTTFTKLRQENQAFAREFIQTSGAVEAHSKNIIESFRKQAEALSGNMSSGVSDSGATDASAKEFVNLKAAIDAAYESTQQLNAAVGETSKQLRTNVQLENKLVGVVRQRLDLQLEYLNAMKQSGFSAESGVSDSGATLETFEQVKKAAKESEEAVKQFSTTSVNSLNSINASIANSTHSLNQFAVVLRGSFDVVKVVNNLGNMVVSLDAVSSSTDRLIRQGPALDAFINQYAKFVNVRVVENSNQKLITHTKQHIALLQNTLDIYSKQEHAIVRAADQVSAWTSRYSSLVDAIRRAADEMTRLWNISNMMRNSGGAMGGNQGLLTGPSLNTADIDKSVKSLRDFDSRLRTIFSQISNLNAGLKGTKGLLQEINVSWKSAFRVGMIQSTHRAVSMLISEVKKSVTSFMDLELAVGRIQTLTKQDIGQEEWMNGILKLSEKTAQSASTVAQAVYDALSNQVADGYRVLEFVEDASKLAIVTNSSVADSSNLMASVLNSFNMDASQSAHVAEVLFQTMDYGRIKLSELANSFGRVGVPANTLGVKFEELMALLASMTIQGVRTSEAMTYITNAINKMIKPTVAMQSWLDESGYKTATNLVAAEGYYGAILKVIEATEGSNEALAKMVNNIRAYLGIMAVTGDQLERTSLYMKIFGNETGRLNRAMELMTNKGAFKLRQEFAALDAYFTKNWGEWLTSILSAVNGISKLTDIVKTLVTVLQAAAVGFAAFKVFGTLVTTITKLSAAIAIVKTTAVASGVAITTLGAAFKATSIGASALLASLNPVTLAATAAAVGYMVISYYKDLREASNLAREARELSREALMAIGERVQSRINGENEVILKGYSDQLAAIQKILAERQKLANQRIALRMNMLMPDFENMQALFGNFVRAYRSHLEELTSSIKTANEAIKNSAEYLENAEKWASDFRLTMELDAAGDDLNKKIAIWKTQLEKIAGEQLVIRAKLDAGNLGLPEIEAMMKRSHDLTTEEQKVIQSMYQLIQQGGKAEAKQKEQSLKLTERQAKLESDIQKARFAREKAEANVESKGAKVTDEDRFKADEARKKEQDLQAELTKTNEQLKTGTGTRQAQLNIEELMLAAVTRVTEMEAAGVAAREKQLQVAQQEVEEINKNVKALELLAKEAKEVAPVKITSEDEFQLALQKYKQLEERLAQIDTRGNDFLLNQRQAVLQELQALTKKLLDEETIFKEKTALEIVEKEHLARLQNIKKEQTEADLLAQAKMVDIDARLEQARRAIEIFQDKFGENTWFGQGDNYADLSKVIEIAMKDSMKDGYIAAAAKFNEILDAKGWDVDDFKDALNIELTQAVIHDGRGREATVEDRFATNSLNVGDAVEALIEGLDTAWERRQASESRAKELEKLAVAIEKTIGGDKIQSEELQNLLKQYMATENEDVAGIIRPLIDANRMKTFSAEEIAAFNKLTFDVQTAIGNLATTIDKASDKISDASMKSGEVTGVKFQNASHETADEMKQTRFAIVSQQQLTDKGWVDVGGKLDTLNQNMEGYSARFASYSESETPTSNMFASMDTTVKNQESVMAGLKGLMDTALTLAQNSNGAAGLTKEDMYWVNLFAEFQNLKTMNDKKMNYLDAVNTTVNTGFEMLVSIDEHIVKGTDAITSSLSSFASSITSAIRAMEVSKVDAEGKAFGGWVRRGGSPSDTVPTMLTPNEFVVNRLGARRYGSLLEDINAGRKPRVSNSETNEMTVNVYPKDSKTTSAEIVQAIRTAERRQTRK